jgi:hypothetical protein
MRASVSELGTSAFAFRRAGSGQSPPGHLPTLGLASTRSASGWEAERQLSGQGGEQRTLVHEAHDD